jgi:hypothetical protein
VSPWLRIPTLRRDSPPPPRCGQRVGALKCLGALGQRSHGTKFTLWNKCDGDKARWFVEFRNRSPIVNQSRKIWLFTHGVIRCAEKQSGMFLRHGRTEGAQERSTAAPSPEANPGRAVPTGGSELPVAMFVRPAEGRCRQSRQAPRFSSYFNFFYLPVTTNLTGAACRTSLRACASV